MGSISKSHIINQASEAEIQKLLPLTHFIKHPLIPDYHKDYLIELNLGNEPSGIFFYVQLKGVENVHITKDFVKFSIKTKHLNYYYDKIKDYPVFLLITNTSKNKTYWLFIQKYLNETNSNSIWRNQKTVTLSITKENLISDLELFQNIVKEANVYMTELWPSSIEAAFKKEKEYFQSLDSRFDKIKMTINSDNSRSYHFHSDDKFNLNFKIKTNLDLKKLFNDPNTDKILLKSSEVNIEGSQLMQEMLSKSDHIEFKLKRPNFDVDMYLMCINENQVVNFIHLKGNPTHKDGVISFQGTQTSSPLIVYVDITITKTKNPMFDFEFDFNHWINTPIQSLPYLDNLSNYFSNINSNSQTSLKIEHKGQSLLVLNTFLNQQLDFIANVKRSFDLIKKLKVIDSYFNLKLKCPDFSKLKFDDVADIEELYDLINTGVHLEVKRKLTGNFVVDKKEGFLELYKNGIDIRFLSDGSYKFLGKDMKIGEHYIDISSPVLLISYDEMKNIYNSSSTKITIKFTTDNNSKVYIRLLSKIADSK